MLNIPTAYGVGLILYCFRTVRYNNENVVWLQPRNGSVTGAMDASAAAGTDIAFVQGAEHDRNSKYAHAKLLNWATGA